MSDVKTQAEILRKEGKSFREISAILGTSISTLSLWFRNEIWSQEIGKTLRIQNTEKGKQGLAKFSRARSFALQYHYEKGKQDAALEFKTLRKNPLFVAAVALYWGEGDKASKYNVRLTNVDPRMILIFSRFLTEICTVPENKIRYWLLLYPDLDEQSCKAYWIENAKITSNSFTKSIYIQGKHKTKKVTHGVGTVVYSSRYMKEKMLVWTRLLAEELSSPAGQSVKKAK
jgi:hypothetical protein